MNKSNQELVAQEINEAIKCLSPQLQATAAILPYPQLHSACMAGELDLVHALLDAGLAPDQYPYTDDENDQPPLRWLAEDRDSAASNALEIAVLLIERSQDVDEGDALQAALEAGDVSMARLLLNAGADEGRARIEVGAVAVALLDALLEPYWAAPVGRDPSYFIALDEDRQICGAGLSAADAISHAQSNDTTRDYEVKAATEGLVAAFLSGEQRSLSVDDDVADAKRN